ALDPRRQRRGDAGTQRVGVPGQRREVALGVGRGVVGRHALQGTAPPDRAASTAVRIRGKIQPMKIRALSVFEGIVYHCWIIDRENPCRPTLEVDAVLREGDADEGPLLLPVADYVTLAGGPEIAGPCLRDLAEKGRIVDHLGVAHLTFPFWTPGTIDRPGDPVHPAG
ncbi:MAG: hypothetical protein JWM05_3705, partial [Acidimicrobiales bacterium]|nr:hypothetical protein [Acidimicrobiales bacterium]